MLRWEQPSTKNWWKLGSVTGELILTIEKKQNRCFGKFEILEIQKVNYKFYKIYRYVQINKLPPKFPLVPLIVFSSLTMKMTWNLCHSLHRSGYFLSRNFGDQMFYLFYHMILMNMLLHSLTDKAFNIFMHLCHDQRYSLS